MQANVMRYVSGGMPTYPRQELGRIIVKYKRIEHIAIAVRNLDSVRDTLDRIGLQCAHEETLPGPGVRLAMLPVGESALELIESKQPSILLVADCHDSKKNPSARFILFD